MMSALAVAFIPILLAPMFARVAKFRRGKTQGHYVRHPSHTQECSYTPVSSYSPVLQPDYEFPVICSFVVRSL